MNSLFPFPIPNVQHVYLYTKSISMRLGENKLIGLYINEMELNPDKGFMFLFFNKSHNKIKLFYLDESGSQEIVKVLPRGGFLLPVASDNQKYIKIDITKLPSLFRM